MRKRQVKKVTAGKKKVKVLTKKPTVAKKGKSTSSLSSSKSKPSVLQRLKNVKTKVSNAKNVKKVKAAKKPVAKISRNNKINNKIPKKSPLKKKVLNPVAVKKTAKSADNLKNIPKKLLTTKASHPMAEKNSKLKVNKPKIKPSIPPVNTSPESAENYMNAEQQAHFRLILINWKKQLLDEMERTVHHMQDDAGNFADPTDRATQEEEFSLELRARDRERKLIKKIEEALQRIDNNEYGYCEGCGVDIGVQRLEARPTATLCIDCKTIDEIREKHYG